MNRLRRFLADLLRAVTDGPRGPVRRAELRRVHCTFTPDDVDAVAVALAKCYPGGRDEHVQAAHYALAKMCSRREAVR